MNQLYSGTLSTRLTLQNVVNLQEGNTPTTQKPFQVILNENLGLAPYALSEQEALWRTLQPDLNLSGSRTRYTVQELLNMAYAQGDVTLPEVIDGDGGLTGQPIGLLLALTYS